MLLNHQNGDTESNLMAYIAVADHWSQLQPISVLQCTDNFVSFEDQWFSMILNILDYDIYMMCNLLFVCLFDLILYVPSTIFQLYRDGSFWVDSVLAQGPQHSDASEVQTRGPSVSSQALYH